MWNPLVEPRSSWCFPLWMNTWRVIIAAQEYSHMLSRGDSARKILRRMRRSMNWIVQVLRRRWCSQVNDFSWSSTVVMRDALHLTWMTVDRAGGPCLWRLVSTLYRRERSILRRSLRSQSIWILSVHNGTALLVSVIRLVVMVLVWLLWCL